MIVFLVLPQLTYVNLKSLAVPISIARQSLRGGRLEMAEPVLGVFGSHALRAAAAARVARSKDDFGSTDGGGGA